MKNTTYSRFLARCSLASSIALFSFSVSAATDSPRGYSYPEPAPANFSIVKDVPETPGNKKYYDYRIDFNSLPFSEAVVRVKGDGSRRMAVIVDPTCPYCRQLEDNMEALDNVTVYTFITSILGGSKELVHSLHCAGDKRAVARAYDAQSKYKEAPEAKTCDSRADERIKQSIRGYKNIDRATPTVIFESNFFMTSLMNADEIEPLLEDSLTTRM